MESRSMVTPARLEPEEEDESEAPRGISRRSHFESGRWVRMTLGPASRASWIRTLPPSRLRRS